jgi:hypothetical protein
MAWPSLVTPGQRILASDFNAIITSFSTWADSVNSVLAANLGQSAVFTVPTSFNYSAAFSAGATFSNVAPTFPAGAYFGAGSVTFASSPTFVSGAAFSAGASFSGGAVTFASNAPATFSGAVTFAVAPSFTDAAGTRTSLGLPSPSTIPTLSGSNTFTAAAAILQTITASAAGGTIFAGIQLNNDLGAWCSLRTYSSTASTALGGITLTNWSVLYCNSGAGFLIETANAAPIVFGINNAERFRFASDGTCQFTSSATFASSSAVTFNGSVTVTQPMSTSGGGISMTRPAAYANSGVTWGLTVQTSSAGDNLYLGQSGASYTVSGTIGWVGNSNAFCYFNSGQDFRIGSGVGSTPIMTFKGSTGIGRVLLGTLTDDGSNILQVAGTAKTTGLNVTNAASVTMGSDWVAFTPSIQATAAGAVAITTNSDFSYYLHGKLCFVKFNLLLSLTGAATNWFNLNLPFNNGAPGGVSAGHVHLSFNSATAWVNGYCYLGSTVFTVTLEGYAAMPTSSSLYLQGEFFYQTT